jgi:hypothetical protein
MERRRALAGIRVCDFTGQLAGAGATKWLAAFGAVPALHTLASLARLHILSCTTLNLVYC